MRLSPMSAITSAGGVPPTLPLASTNFSTIATSERHCILCGHMVLDRSPPRTRSAPQGRHSPVQEDRWFTDRHERNGTDGGPQRLPQVRPALANDLLRLYR